MIIFTRPIDASMFLIHVDKPTFDFDSDTLAVLRGRLVRFFIRKKEVNSVTIILLSVN